MTTIEILTTSDRAAAIRRTRSIVRTVLLACGLASSVLYIATDILGGLSYSGYSFASRAISELGAIGAPSAGIVAPLYAIYSVLVLLFGAAVLREVRHNNPPLALSGLLLTMYAAVGIVIAIIGASGSATFNMHQRGTASVAADAPHIILTAVFVVLLLAMIATGAFAFGRKFRVYSFVTLAIVIIFAGLTVPFAPRLAAGRPTPGLGIIERINVYAAVLWPGLLSLAILRRPRSAGRSVV